jgi:hypothetical protein
MKNIIYPLALLLTLGLFQCTEQKSQSTYENVDFDDTYLKSYSGGYTIEIEGLGNTGEAELYVLADNGKAQWMYIATRAGKEPEIISKKFGSWTATDSYIKISIDGNTGQLIEEYELKNGVFRNKETQSRYLKQTVN